MDSHSLGLFVAVARSGSFARVARQRAVAPSSVSRSIESLEDELGTRLFQRTTRKLSITEAGQRMLAHVEPLLEQLQLARAVALGTEKEPAGTLRITAPVAFGQVVLTPLLVEFAERYRSITIDAVLRDDVVDLVAERVDVAVRLGKLHDSALVAQRLGKLGYAACASPGYLAERGTPEHPQELSEHDCLYYRVPGVRPTWSFRARSGARGEVTVRGPISINNGMALCRCARAGLGITLVPRWNVEEELARGALVELFPDFELSATDVDAGVWLVFPTRRQLPPNARLFIDFLSKKLRPYLKSSASAHAQPRNRAKARSGRNGERGAAAASRVGRSQRATEK